MATCKAMEIDVKKPKYVIFDCDGVLVDSEIIANRIEVEMKTELGISITLEEQILKFAGCGKNHPVVQKEALSLPIDYWQRYHERCAERYETELSCIDNVKETLEKIMLPMCVASSSEPESLDRKLEITRLRGHFPAGATFHGGLVQRPKPEPDLFLHAIKAMGWNAEDCLVVEDSVPGVTAGRAAGLIVCGFLGGKHIYPGHADRLVAAGADYIVSDMRRILPLIS